MTNYLNHVINEDREKREDRAAEVVGSTPPGPIYDLRPLIYSSIPEKSIQMHGSSPVTEVL